VQPGAATVLVGGQAPAEAVAEVRAIAEVLAAGKVLAAGEPHRDATVLTGSRAGVAAVLAAVDGTGCAHLATHGSFRADNPLFSHLRLADGPLTVYDLSGLGRPPALLILSACDSGLSAVHPGDELQGLSAAMLGLGTRAVVASLGPVRDEATRALMVDLHRHLSRGAAPAAALAAAQAALDPSDASTAGSFVCLGAG
jgi:CHAT domain-containing protein